MNKLILLLILTATSLLLHSQEIVDTNKLWSNMEEHCHAWGSSYSTDSFKFNGDTIVDGTEYKKVWISLDENNVNWDFYGAFIREDNNRVFYKQMFGNEGLIYDFNLNIGDSVLVDNPNSAGEIWLFLEAIDSIETINGMRERWSLKSNEYPNYEYWIRGIGSQNGVLYSSTGVYGGLCGLFTLLCQKENDELIYLNPDFETCYLYTVGRDEITKITNDIRIVNNPGSNNVSIITNIESDKQFVLTDIRGTIISKVSTTTNSLSFSLPGSGIYIISIYSSGNRYSKKFINY